MFITRGYWCSQQDAEHTSRSSWDFSDLNTAGGTPSHFPNTSSQIQNTYEMYITPCRLFSLCTKKSIIHLGDSITCNATFAQ